MWKPKRSNNFTKSEENKLVRLVMDIKHVLENKKTDALTSRMKDIAWEELAEKFNADSPDEIRTVKVLRDKYNNIKRQIRRTKGDDRRDLILSGEPPSKKLENPILGALGDVINLNVDGLPSGNVNNDQLSIQEVLINSDEDIIEFFDADLFEALEASEATIEDHELTEESNISTDLQKYQPDIEKSKRNQLLKTSKRKTKEQNEDAAVTQLKLRILEQQLHHAELEHKQKMLHVEEEHKQKLKLAQLEHEQKMLHNTQVLEAKLKKKKLPQQYLEY